MTAEEIMVRNMRTPSRSTAARVGCAVGVAALVVSLGGARRATAQPGADGRGMLVRSFEQSAPAIGALMPDLPVYDRDGREVRLREVLGGRYTVLVLGCLT